MTSESFQMAVKIPTDNSLEVKMRIAMALVEAAIDRALAARQTAFEQSCIDNVAPLDHLADLMLWHHEEMLAWREQALAGLRQRLGEWFQQDGTRQ
jgi:hypothetical protein